MMKRKSRLRSVWNRKQWLVPYLSPWPFKRTLWSDPGPRHVLFSFVDHFEPGHGGADPARQLKRVEQWRRGYPEVVGQFQDCEGNFPKHTWFYLGEEPGHLKLLAELCFQGFGEVELHIHHGPKDNIPDHWKQNSLQGLARYIETQKQLFARYGALITGERLPQKVFGFIHGMFALDNSLPDYCGLPGELQLLKSLGCYGDFTFPAPGKSQPPLINRLYYPTGNPGEGGSYYKGDEIKVGSDRREQVLIFQGPLGLVRKGFKIQVEDGHLDWSHPPTRERVLSWISKGIHVQGRPEWVFVKVHTHGAMERNVQELLGGPMERLHKELRNLCREGPPIFLHYVSAREAFNIAMAAMAGKEGDPGQFRNFLIPPYANTQVNCNRPYQLEGYSRQGWSLQTLDSREVLLKVKGEVETEVKADHLEGLSLSQDFQKGTMGLQAQGKGRIEGRFKNLNGKDTSLVAERREGEVGLFRPSDELGVSFSGSFSSRGVLEFWVDFRR